jgi:hypothetical protein
MYILNIRNDFNISGKSQICSSQVQYNKSLGWIWIEAEGACVKEDKELSSSLHPHLSQRQIPALFMLSSVGDTTTNATKNNPRPISLLPSNSSIQKLNSKVSRKTRNSTFISYEEITVDVRCGKQKLFPYAHEKHFFFLIIIITLHSLHLEAKMG